LAKRTPPACDTLAGIILKDRTMTFDLQPGKTPSGDVITMEFGARLDRESVEVVNRQITLARRLYNDIVAAIRAIVGEMNDYVLERAGPQAADLQARIETLTAEFAEAKARDDEPAMKRVAEERRGLWRELGAALKGVRKEARAEIQSRFLSRIGKNAGCDTYRLRSAAVAGGLGWATANAVLDNTLTAFKKAFALGRPPRFAIGAEKDQDTLTLQFTAAGGVPADTLLSGGHGELAILPTNGCGRRKYGEFRFRLGPAKDESNATGTWQYHRPIPPGASIAVARLVRRRIGKDTRWAIQLMVKPRTPVSETVPGRKPLVVIHFGWAADLDGRRVAGIADSADSGAAKVVQLPPQIEEALDYAAALQGERDADRDRILPLVKAIHLHEGAPEALKAAMEAIRPLRPQYVSANRLNGLCRQLHAVDRLPPELEEWRRADRIKWQSHTHIARRARNARRDFYRKLAIDLARRYDAIVIEPLDLAETARKVDERTGEKTEFGRKARSGRVVAALYELESALRWAAAKTGAAVLDLTGRTASVCAICGGTVQVDDEDSQVLHCDACGAELDRKQNGAAVAFQFASAVREDVVTQFWTEARDKVDARKAAQAEKREKMAQGRRAARQRDEETAAAVDAANTK
jgi:hypothetical protein